jgi:hypothetical protein
MDGQNGRRRAYRAGARIARDRMAVEASLDADALASVEAGDVVVVRGCYDHVERVLDALDTPVAGSQMGAVRLRPEQLLVENCPGHLPGLVTTQIESFVAAGGSLFTTDWALRHVIEPCFPGTIAYSGRPTSDDVVRVEINQHDNPFLTGVMDGRDDPQWWLEASSYPIQIIDRDRVEVLIASSELEQRYGESPGRRA